MRLLKREEPPRVCERAELPLGPRDRVVDVGRCPDRLRSASVSLMFFNSFEGQGNWLGSHGWKTGRGEREWFHFLSAFGKDGQVHGESEEVFDLFEFPVKLL